MLVSIFFFNPPSKCAGIYTNIKRFLFSERLQGKSTPALVVLVLCNDDWLSSPPPADVLLGPGGAVRGGGTRPGAAGAPGHRRAEEQAAEGARAQGEALPEERPQGCTQGRAGGPGAAGEAAGRREDGGASPQRNNAGRAGALHEHGNTPADAALTHQQPDWTGKSRRRDCWAVATRGTSSPLQEASAHFE